MKQKAAKRKAKLAKKAKYGKDTTLHFNGEKNGIDDIIENELKGDYDVSSSSQYSDSSYSSDEEDNVLGIIHPIGFLEKDSHHKKTISPEYLEKEGKKYAVLDWEDELREPRRKLSLKELPHVKESDDDFEEAPKMEWTEGSYEEFRQHKED